MQRGENQQNQYEQVEFNIPAEWVDIKLDWKTTVGLSAELASFWSTAGLVVGFRDYQYPIIVSV